MYPQPPKDYAPRMSTNRPNMFQRALSDLADALMLLVLATFVAFVLIVALLF